MPGQEMTVIDQSPFDLSAAHRHFAAECFNAAWDLIDKPARTSTEDEQMLLLAMASFYHWTQRPDCTPKSRSISLWQISRVYALLGQPENARRYGEQCLTESDVPDVPVFYLAYAYEALARAEMVAGDKTKMQKYLKEARRTSERVEDEQSKKMLLDDLTTIK
jgi:hypothetical protein